MRRLAFLVSLSMLVLSPPAYAATEAELIALVYINETPWALKVMIDGRYAVETNEGNEIPPHSHAIRFAQPGAHRLTAYATVRKWKAEWLIGRLAPPLDIPAAASGRHIAISFYAEDIAPLSTGEFLAANWQNFATATFLAALGIVFLACSALAFRAFSKMRGLS